jgi:hypothetical protein
MTLESDLEGFIGTEEYHRYPIGPLLLTEGAAYLAKEAKCYWLVDAIGSYQGELFDGKLAAGRRRLREFGFQFWTLEVKEDKSAVLSCVEDSGVEPLVVQTFRYTDFPMRTVMLYLQGGVLMLPSEY